jgi:hypothetical protein
MLPWFTDAELLTVLRRPEGAATVAQLFAEREERIFLAGDTDGADPLRYGFELPCWRDADGLAREFKFLYIAGGKRAGKSERAAKRLVQSALKYPRGTVWAFQGNAKTSVAAQQTLIWKYLPPEIKALNGKQDRRKVFNVNYSEKNGFADGILVLPNRTKLYFLTYEMEVKQYQGWTIGSAWKQGMPLTETERRMQELVVGTAGEVESLGWWADEDMPFPWLETCELRSSTNNARGLWTFSTTEGITTAIKQVLGTAVTLESRPAELLPDRVNLPLLPRGHMPYRQRCERTDWGAIYFFSEFNPFGENYANVKAFCAGKTSDVVMENAYGYARDTRHKAFPIYGEWNVIKRANLPARMTRYMLTDPGDASRNWATIWVGVDERGWHYVYRDWPDEQTYGEWAVPSEDPKQPDGSRGPAQRTLGFGTQQLAETWRRLEDPNCNCVADGPVTKTAAAGVTKTAAGAATVTPGAGVLPEAIFDRYIDPRAASNPHIEEQGGTDLYRQFAELAEPMIFNGWQGKRMEAGYTAVNALLFWDRDKPLSPVNAPKLYVCEDCLQVRWMFSNFTGLGGEKAGSKDFADLVRGMALADLQYYESNEMRSSGGGRGY